MPQIVIRRKTIDRFKLRRLYLLKRAGWRAAESIAFIVFLPWVCAALFLDIMAIFVWGGLVFYSFSQPELLGFGVVWAILCSLPGIIATLVAALSWRAYDAACNRRDALIYVPPVNVNTLPDGEVLVRGSSRNDARQARELLRAAFNFDISDDGLLHPVCNSSNVPPYPIEIEDSNTHLDFANPPISNTSQENNLG